MKLGVAEMRMLQWMCEVTKLERIRNKSEGQRYQARSKQCMIVPANIILCIYYISPYWEYRVNGWRQR